MQNDRSFHPSLLVELLGTRKCHRIFESDWLSDHTVVEVGHASFMGDVVHICLCFSLNPCAFLTFIASVSVSRRKTFIASGSPEHPSLGIHGTDGTTHVSSFVRASGITLR